METIKRRHVYVKTFGLLHFPECTFDYLIAWLAFVLLSQPYTN